jgi:fluoride ion exporter CrcB/FEX
VGCILRFYASVKLNGLISSFPLGTFAVNVFGTAVLGMAFDLQHVSIGGAGVGGGRITCQVLQGIMDGFCGALTTVSTWILELNALRRGHAYIYGAASVGAGFAILVVVMGSVRWSVGWTAPMCVT